MTVEGLVIALDCDVCHAFSKTDTRPDIIAVQRCSGTHQWLVLEMKTTMREHAAKQARAALKRLGHEPMFRVHIDNVRVFFIIKNRRRSDNLIMRKIKTIDVGQWTVLPRLLTSHSTIFC